MTNTEAPSIDLELLSHFVNTPVAQKQGVHMAHETAAALVAAVKAALSVDEAFKRAGDHGVTFDWTPVAETLKPFTTNEDGK